MTEFLTVDQVIEIHDEMLRRYGGLAGIRDVNLLHSSVFLPQTAAFGQDLCPSIYDKAAAYMFYIVRNHPFCDGNKRTGYTAALIFLQANGIDIVFDKEDLEKIVIEVASGKFGKEQLAYFFEHGENHSFVQK